MRLVHYSKADKIFLIDLSNLAFICYYGYRNKITSSVKEICHVYGFVEKLFSMLRPYSGKKLGLVFALDNPAKRKKELFPEYKAGRKELEFDPKPDCKKLVKYFNCSIIESEHEEADDVIASFCRDQIHSDVIVDVVTTDKDLWQLGWQKNIRIYNPVKKKIILRSDLTEAFGLKDHTKIPLWKAVFGDPSDNIKASIARIQKKLVIPLINNSDGTVDSLYKEFDLNKNIFTPNAWEKIALGVQAMKRNFAIVKLCEDVVYTENNKNGNLNFLIKFMTNFDSSVLVDEIEFFAGGDDSATI